MINKNQFAGFAAHQGDTQWFKVKSLPSGAKEIEKTFIAKSERSGHAHALCGDYKMFTVEGKQGHYVQVGPKGATLNHTRYENLTKEYWDKNEVMTVADHLPTTLTEGTYFVGIQKRKKHFSKVWQNVKD